MAITKKASDLILIAVMLLISLVLFWVLNINKEPGALASVAVNGVETETYPLDEDGVFFVNGGTNCLEIKDGRARLIDADCPDKLCVKQGWIGYCGQSIICLPNRLTVTLTQGPDDVDFVM